MAFPPVRSIYFGTLRAPQTAESLHDLVYSRPAPVWAILAPNPELLP
jgi:hypothetical protein